MNNTNMIIYQNEDGTTELEIKLENETIWLSQKQLAELFSVTTATINEHIKNIYREKELEENPTIRNFLIVQQEGKRKVKRDIEHYSLDMIISVGYRVNSQKATQFRIWATKIFQEYIIRGINANWLTIIKNKIIESVKEIYGFCSWSGAINIDEYQMTKKILN